MRCGLIVTGNPVFNIELRIRFPIGRFGLFVVNFFAPGFAVIFAAINTEAFKILIAGQNIRIMDGRSIPIKGDFPIVFAGNYFRSFRRSGTLIVVIVHQLSDARIGFQILFIFTHNHTKRERNRIAGGQAKRAGSHNEHTVQTVGIVIKQSLDGIESRIQLTCARFGAQRMEIIR